MTKWPTKSSQPMIVKRCEMVMRANSSNSCLNNRHCCLLTPCSGKIFGKLKPHVIKLTRDGICKPLLRPDGRGGSSGGGFSLRTTSPFNGSALAVGMGLMGVTVVAGGGFECLAVAGFRPFCIPLLLG